MTSISKNSINLQNVQNKVNFQGKTLKFGNKDYFMGTREITREEKEKYTHEIVKDAILPNLNHKTAVINNFDADEYMNGTVDSNGKIIVKDEKLHKMLTALKNSIPEFSDILGRPQHITHQYSLDTHTLKTLQNCVQHPLYSTLSDFDKTILQLSVLFHDVSKPAYEIDKQHPEKSAVIAERILNNLNFPDEINSRVVKIINNHHWYERYNRGLISAEDIVEAVKTPKDFKLLEIMADADLKSVNDYFYEMYGTELPNASYEIEKAFLK